MGVKYLWSILSPSSQVIAIGSPGNPIIGSAAAINSEEEHLSRKLSDLKVGRSKPSRNENIPSSSIMEEQLTSPHDVGVAFAGQAVAIDLSCWVCDSQANQNMVAVVKPHLR